MTNAFEPQPCLWCNEIIQRTDLRHALIDQHHLACALRAVTGSIAHHEQRCGCFVPGATCTDPDDLTRRESAELVLAYIRAHPLPLLPDPRRDAN